MPVLFLFVPLRQKLGLSLHKGIAALRVHGYHQGQLLQGQPLDGLRTLSLIHI